MHSGTEFLEELLHGASVSSAPRRYLFLSDTRYTASA